MILVDAMPWVMTFAKGTWSLPNGLGGGDLDGYSVRPYFRMNDVTQKTSVTSTRSFNTGICWYLNTMILLPIHQ